MSIRQTEDQRFSLWRWMLTLGAPASRRHGREAREDVDAGAPKGGRDRFAASLWAEMRIAGPSPRVTERAAAPGERTSRP